MEGERNWRDIWVAYWWNRCLALYSWGLCRATTWLSRDLVILWLIFNLVILDRINAGIEGSRWILAALSLATLSRRPRRTGWISRATTNFAIENCWLAEREFGGFLNWPSGKLPLRISFVSRTSCVSLMTLSCNLWYRDWKTLIRSR